MTADTLLISCCTSNEPTTPRGLGNRKLVDYPLETIDVGDSKTID